MLHLHTYTRLAVKPKWWLLLKLLDFRFSIFLLHLLLLLCSVFSVINHYLYNVLIQFHFRKKCEETNKTIVKNREELRDGKKRMNANIKMDRMRVKSIYTSILLRNLFLTWFLNVLNEWKWFFSFSSSVTCFTQLHSFCGQRGIFEPRHSIHS